MDMISKALELGDIILQDDRFLQMEEAKAKNDEDETLQKLMRHFNLLRMNLNTESSKLEPDATKLEDLDRDINDTYEEIMNNPSMRAYATAKEEFETQLQLVNRIVEFAAGGLSPEAALEDTPSGGGCSGSCGGCSGCQ